MLLLGDFTEPIEVTPVAWCSKGLGSFIAYASFDQPLVSLLMTSGCVRKTRRDSVVPSKCVVKITKCGPSPAFTPFPLHSFFQAY